jgi:hypothetical protein
MFASPLPSAVHEAPQRITNAMTRIYRGALEVLFAITDKVID